jgi:flagellum-specific peptidoglycan hydrolase FlgJ
MTTPTTKERVYQIMLWIQLLFSLLIVIQVPGCVSASELSNSKGSSASNNKAKHLMSTIATTNSNENQNEVEEDDDDEEEEQKDDDPDRCGLYMAKSSTSTPEEPKWYVHKYFARDWCSTQVDTYNPHLELFVCQSISESVS